MHIRGFLDPAYSLPNDCNLLLPGSMFRSDVTLHVVVLKYSATLITDRLPAWRILGAVMFSCLHTWGEAMILQLLLALLAGWVQRHPQQVITYRHAENRVLKS